MIEDVAIVCMLAVFGIPLLIGGIYAWITRPSKYYYKHNGYYWKRKNF